MHSSRALCLRTGIFQGTAEHKPNKRLPQHRIHIDDTAFVPRATVIVLREALKQDRTCLYRITVDGRHLA